VLIEWVATAAIGFGAAGVMLLLRIVTRRTLPRFATPAAAGLAMIGFVIWSEYSWFPRTVAALPPEVVVTGSHAEPSAFRPWTYVRPFVNRFSAVDRGSIRRNARVPGQIMIEILLFNRHGPTAKLPLLVDCDGHRRANIVDGVTFDANGAATDAEWHALEPDDPLIGAACNGA